MQGTDGEYIDILESRPAKQSNIYSLADGNHDDDDDDDDVDYDG